MKYIDADRLKAEIEKRLKNVRDYMNGAGMRYKGPKYLKAQGKESAYDALLNIIDSLQQEQDIVVINKKDWEAQEIFRKNEDFWKPLQHEQLPRIEENGISGKDFIPVEWVDACEKYGKWKIVKVEQPEVDLEKEIDEHVIYMPLGEFASDNERQEDVEWAKKEFRHFYELGRLNARKEG